VIRRAAKGGTTHPSLARPGYGFGRPLRPDPDRRPDRRPWLDPGWWLASTELAEPGERERAVP
jgi:hypothetical protein